MRHQPSACHASRSAKRPIKVMTASVSGPARPAGCVMATASIWLGVCIARGATVLTMVSTSQPNTAASPRPAPTTEARRRWFALLVVCLGVMMTFVNVSSTISALPPIQDDLHMSAITLVWVSSAFSLAVVSLVLSAGTLSDLLGRRRIFCYGVAVVTLG